MFQSNILLFVFTLLLAGFLGKDNESHTHLFNDPKASAPEFHSIPKRSLLVCNVFHFLPFFKEMKMLYCDISKGSNKYGLKEDIPDLIFILLLLKLLLFKGSDFGESPQSLLS